MDAESSGWAVRERSDGTWDVVENTTSTAYRVGAALGTRLWREDEFWPLPLHEALDAVSGPDRSGDGEAMPFVDLVLAGGTVRYHTADAAVQRWLRTGLAAAVPVRRRTADVLVRLDRDARADLLHRSFSGERPGVRYRMPGDPRWHALTGHLPALPPLATPPYRGRFVALHAALLVPAPGRAVLVCGHQKAGKTTAALWARDAGLAAVATDEVVLLDSLTGAVFGVPLPVAVRTGGRRKLRTAAEGGADVPRRLPARRRRDPPPGTGTGTGSGTGAGAGRSGRRRDRRRDGPRRGGGDVVAGGTSP